MEFTEEYLKETAPFTDNRVSLRRLQRTEEGQKKKLTAKLQRALLQK